MTTPNVQQNLQPNEPSLRDLLNLLKKQIKLEINCHHLGSVESFNASRQTATATINYKKTFFEPNDSGVYTAVLRDYPVLIDCPVVVLGGGGGSTTYPIEKGDECIILFNDRCIDDWFSGSSSSPVPIPRLHSISDGLIIVGVRSLANVLRNYDATRAVLRLGQALVGVGGSGGVLVKIANDSTTLNTLLQSLMTDLLALSDPLTGAAFQFGVLATAAVGPLAALKPGFLALQTLFITANTSFQVLSTDIGGLLE